MATNAEIIVRETRMAICRKILIEIQNNCKTLQDAEKFVEDLIEVEEKGV